MIKIIGTRAATRPHLQPVARKEESPGPTRRATGWCEPTPPAPPPPRPPAPNRRSAGCDPDKTHNPCRLRMRRALCSSNRPQTPPDVPAVGATTSLLEADAPARADDENQSQATASCTGRRCRTTVLEAPMHEKRSEMRRQAELARRQRSACKPERAGYGAAQIATRTPLRSILKTSAFDPVFERFGMWMIPMHHLLPHAQPPPSPVPRLTRRDPMDALVHHNRLHKRGALRTEPRKRHEPVHPAVSVQHQKM